MHNKVERFFIPHNTVMLDNELDYSRVGEYIRAAEAFSRSTYQGVYIIDYYRRNFLYVSPNPLFLCGHTPEEVRDMGYGFYMRHVPEDEHRLLLTINSAGFEFFSRIPVEERKEWSISYDFHIAGYGPGILVNHKLTPLELTSDGRIWLAFCLVSASSHSEAGHVEVRHAGSQERLRLNLATQRWQKDPMPVLTDCERSVLVLSIQGHTIPEIADRICLSPDSVKKYRQRIFEKLGVRNISEAIVAATNSKLI